VPWTPPGQLDVLRPFAGDQQSKDVLGRSFSARSRENNSMPSSPATQLFRLDFLCLRWWKATIWNARNRFSVKFADRRRFLAYALLSCCRRRAAREIGSSASWRIVTCQMASP